MEWYFVLRNFSCELVGFMTNLWELTFVFIGGRSTNWAKAMGCHLACDLFLRAERGK